MHTPDLYLGLSVTVVVTALGAIGYMLHRNIVTYGSYPHDIALDGTYLDKAKYSAKHRFDFMRIALIFLLLGGGGSGLAVIGAAGIVHLAG